MLLVKIMLLMKTTFSHRKNYLIWRPILR